MYKLYDFKCGDCGVFEELVDSGCKTTQCKCGKRSSRIFTPSVNVVGCDSFNPHYDMQVGAYFESASEKKSFLKESGREQTSGFDSPRKSNATSIVCTREQASKRFGVTKSIKDKSPGSVRM